MFCESGSCDDVADRFCFEDMKLEDVAVLCVLVLLLRVRPFPEPGFAELGPLLRVNICTLDACISGFVC